MGFIRKIMKLITIPLLASFVYSCDIGGNSSNSNFNNDRNPINDGESSKNQNDESSNNNKVSIELGGDTIPSVYGNATLKFKEGVIYEILNTSETSIDNVSATVVVPHKGTSSITLNIPNASNNIFITGYVNDSPLATHSYFKINSGGSNVNMTGVDSQNNINLKNFPAIKLSIKNGTAYLDWQFIDESGNSEGKEFTMSNLFLYNITNQDELNLVDYFNKYTIKFNTLPIFSIIPSINCPVNKVDIDGDGIVDMYEIPPSKNCISFKFINQDDIGNNPEYSIDNGASYIPVEYNKILEFTVNGNPGNLISKTLTVREYLDSNLSKIDYKDISIKYYRDIDRTQNTNLVGRCVDSITGTTDENLQDSSVCKFPDPGTSTEVGIISISGSSANYGDCNLLLYKNGDFSSPIIDKSVPCKLISGEYIIPSDDKGKGEQSLTFVVKKLYDNGVSKEAYTIDTYTINYRVYIKNYSTYTEVGSIDNQRYYLKITVKNDGDMVLKGLTINITDIDGTCNFTTTVFADHNLVLNPTEIFSNTFEFSPTGICKIGVDSNFSDSYIP